MGSLCKDATSLNTWLHVCVFQYEPFFMWKNLVAPVGCTSTNTKAQCISLACKWTTLRHGVFKPVHWVKKQKRQMYTLKWLLERPDEEREQHKGCCGDQGVRMPGRGGPGEAAVRVPLSTRHGLGIEEYRRVSSKWCRPCKSPHIKQQQRSSTQKPQTRKWISKTVGSSGCLSHTSGPERVWGVGLKKKATRGQAARHTRAKNLQRKPQSLVPCSLARPALFCSRRWLVSTGCHSQAHSSVGPEPLCHTVATFLIAVDIVQQVWAVNPGSGISVGRTSGQFVGERGRLGHKVGAGWAQSWFPARRQEGWHAQLFQGKGHSMRAGQTFTLKCVPSS